MGKAAGPHGNSDAECSSGYLALASARDAIQAGECSVAAAGGVFMLLKPDLAIGCLASGMMSPTGSCTPLSETANGTIWGEAVSAVVLQRDPTAGASLVSMTGHAVVKNNPKLPLGFADPDTMAAATTSALLSAGLQPAQVALVHLHAMGSAASDVPEIYAVANGLASGTRSNPLMLAGHKANCGHSVSASGLVAMLVTTMAMQHHQVPVHLNVTKCSRSIRDRPSLMLPIACPAELEVGSLHFASISGTSASGDNVHLVLKHDPESRQQVILGSKCTTVASKNQALPKQQSDSPQPPKDDLEEQVAAAEVSVDVYALMESGVGSIQIQQHLVLSSPESEQVLLGQTACTHSAMVTHSLERSPNQARAEHDLSVTHVYDCGPLSHQVAQELQVLQASYEGEQDIRAAPELTLATQLQPMLTREGYSTTPSFSTLLAMGPEELCAITGFKVHRVNAGSLEWLVPVDLRGANLDCVDISRTGVSLDKSQLPMLDCSCQVVAEQVFPKPSASAEKALHFAKKLRARVENSGHGFQSYDAESGVLMFQVEHFSRVSTELHPN